jgi:allophanate hydrolase
MPGPPVYKREQPRPRPIYRSGVIASMTDGFDRTSNAAGPEPQPAYPTIDIAVFGAHLSGQPLNPSLLALGATRQRACLTAPTYRMLALSGPLPRPALCRVSRGGVGLPGEVWALPTSALAALLVSIAPPLGLGTVQLDDGPCHGFIAEHTELTDAIDITSFGGWAAWLETRKRS